MTIFIERFLLAVLVVIVGALAFTNPLGFSVIVRVVGVIVVFVLAAIAAFFAERVQRQRVHSEQVPHDECIPTSIGLDVLRSFYENRTKVEGDRLLAPYRGRSVTIEDVVSDVQTTSLNNLCVSSYHFAKLPHNTTLMYFSGSWKDRIETLRIGDIIKVKGKIMDATNTHVALRDCALLDVRAPGVDGTG